MASFTTRPPFLNSIPKARRLGLFVGGLEFNENQRIPLINKCAFQADTFQNDAFQLCSTSNFQDGAGAASGDATASAVGDSTVFPFAHQQAFEVVQRRGRRFATTEQRQVLQGIYTQKTVDSPGAASGDATASATGDALADGSGAASGDATASAAGDSTVFPFAHQSQFDVVRRARRIVTLDQWQTLPNLHIPAVSSDGVGAASGDATASATGDALADGAGAASGDATASAGGDSTVFPFAHQQQFDIVGRRGRRFATTDQSQVLQGIYTQKTVDSSGAASGDATAAATGDGDASLVGSASGDATASATGDSTVFPFSREQLFWSYPRARRGMVQLETWQNTLAAHTTVSFTQADGSAIGDATASAVGESLADSVGAASGDATADAGGSSFVDAVGFAQGGSEASAIGRRSRRVKLVQGREGSRRKQMSYTARRQTVQGEALPIRGTINMMHKAGSAAYPSGRGKADVG